ncbi:hypothetical protein GGS24DRAFT_438083 [Hypoxylon argillaceum]|nr:hypothetical protein GGS24DRAFT_438083 [Hypoxylon argillaceum]
MAPVPFIHPVRYPPLILAAGHISSIVYLTYAIGNSLYTSYKSLGPPSNTRSRIEQRRKLLPIFLGLSITSFLAAAYYTIKFATLSYKTWAHEHGLDLTQQLFGEDENSIPGSQDSSLTFIAHWLSDTPIYNDALEMVAEKARRFWWGQQIDLGTAAFSLMLVTEGRRRNIPLLPAFLALARLVNLSFSQNLFFLAVLLTPSPLHSGDRDLDLPAVRVPSSSSWNRFQNKLVPPKPNGWVPDARVFYVAITLSFVSTFVLPYATGTSTFSNVAFVARASTFLPVLLPKIIPVRWGSVQRRPHGAYESIAKLFKFLSAFAFALHAKTTLVALLSNAPASHYHRHSALLPWDAEERSFRERSTTAFGKVLGSTSDHPIVAAAGWDVLLCALSLGLWAAVRSLNTRDMMSSSIPTYSSDLSTFKWSSPDKGDIRDDVLNFLESESDHDHDHDHEPSTPSQRQGKTTQRVNSIASSSGASEEPISPSKRRRGRPRKTKPVAADDTDEEQPSSRFPKQQPKVAEDDKAYVPTPAVAGEAVGGDEPPPEEPDWEAASLAWGLAAFGGLASACASVFGGECVS